MKKILLTTIAVAAVCIGASGQGTIEFENSDGNGLVSVYQSGTLTASGLVVELLWYSSMYGFIVEDTFTSTFTGSGNSANGPGYFTANPLTVTIPVAGTQTFEVEAFYTFGSDAYQGITPSFTAIVRTSPTPPTSDDAPGDSSWNGNLQFLPVPEPGTIALSGLGAATLLLFRRRK